MCYTASIAPIHIFGHVVYCQNKTQHKSKYLQYKYCDKKLTPKYFDMNLKHNKDNELHTRMQFIAVQKIVL